MNEIVLMNFGSHLYGTATPESDRDLKGVFVPDGRSILLGRVKDTVTVHSKAASSTARNGPEDVDRESYALHKFLRLCAEGQTVAMDMLFAPAWTWIAPPGDTEIWCHIQKHRGKLLSRQVKGFLGYCRQQANKYGIKGSRVAAARAVRDFLLDRDPRMKISEANVEPLTRLEHVAIVPVEIRGQAKFVDHLEVCGRKISFTTTVKEGLAIASRLFDEYGKRALAAERSEGVDWKALSHAVRVGRQAVELLETGHVTFPRPEAAHLTRIKLGELPYQPIAKEIEELLVEVESAAERSTLPETPDLAWIDDFVAATYKKEVMNAAEHPAVVNRLMGVMSNERE